MLSKADIKYITGLQLKKQRQKYSQFIVEGEKSITELLKSHFKIHKLYAVNEWIITNQQLQNKISIIEISEKELQQISTHQTPQKAIAIVDMPANTEPNLQNNTLIIGLDEIQDPGNMGTIIRIADWYGIQNIVCSIGCTDVFSPKTIAATMGSFTRVNVHYTDILEFAKKHNLPIYTTAFNGESIYSINKINKGIIVIGNEGHGVSADLIKASTKQLTIPRIGNAESLNAAISTAIVLDNLVGRG